MMSSACRELRHALTALASSPGIKSLRLADLLLRVDLIKARHLDNSSIVKREGLWRYPRIGNEEPHSGGELANCRTGLP
jgi:hypothetical protein